MLICKYKVYKDLFINKKLKSNYLKVRDKEKETN